jgi:iron(III) transport system permease protein
MFLPLVYLVVRAISAGESAWSLLLRDRTLQVFIRTILLAGTTTLISVLVAIPLAWLTVRTDLPLRRFWSVITALPLVIPTYIGGFTIAAALGPRGMLQQLLTGPLGIQRLPEIYGFPGALLALTLFSYPYVLLSVRAGLRGIDPALEEASRSLGHGAWSTFWHVTLPQLRPSIAAGGLLVALYALSDFGAVSLMQFDSFTRAIYVQYQATINRGFAAVLSLALIVLTLVVLSAETWTRGRARYYRVSGGVARPKSLVHLGYWRWLALAFCTLVMLMALVLPIGVILFWLISGLIQGEPLRLVWDAAWNSVFASSVAAIIAVIAAIPIAVLAVRYPDRLSRLLERSTYIGHALPGIIVALALVFFSIHFAHPIYQTFVLLIFGYVVLFLPQAVGAIRASLLQVSPHLEEAARSLGRTLPQVLVTVTLPMIRPGILAGAALVFLTTMKELPATLLLSPIGFQTLATRIWSASAEAFWARAAAPALLLVLASSVSMVFMVFQDDYDK